MFKSFFKWLSGNECDSSENSEKPCCCTSGDVPEKVVSLEDLQGFVAYVAKALVDDPDSLTVAVENGENCRILRIKCRKEDTGKIIGKKGKTISAMRALVNGAAGRLQERVSVEVAD